MTALILASHNAHKLQEFQAGFAGTHFVLSSATDHGIGDIPETGTNFLENATLKAQTVTDATGIMAMGDDSGLIVDGLLDQYGEFPGLYSKRFMEETGSYDAAVLELLRRLDGKAPKIHYHCTLVLTRPDQEPLVATGDVYGTLVYPRRGDNNFGFDPWFRPDGETRTFAEMSLDEKRAIDHRTKALNQMLKLLTV